MVNPDFMTIPYLPFWDYKTGKYYSDDDLKKGQLWTKSYWKPLSRIVRDYINHPEAKSDGDIGKLKRRVIKINQYSIRYIGKETNNLGEAEVIGVGPENYTEYINWCTIIDSLTVDIALAYGLSRRHLIRLKEKVKECKPIQLRHKTKVKLLKRLK